MSNDLLLTLQNVGYTYKVKKTRFKFTQYEALKGICLDVYKGETLGLIGRNGAGKSTLLRLLAGIYSPSTGTITRHKEIAVSLLTLQAGFSPELSGRDNAIMGAMLAGYTRAQAEARLPSIIEFSELKEWIDEPIKTYSAGMRARLGFTVAMEMAPDILLIDEVLGVGDVTFRQKSSEKIKQRILSGQTVVITSHNMNAIKELCNRVAWVENGIVNMIDSADVVLKEYNEVMTKN